MENSRLRNACERFLLTFSFPPFWVVAKAGYSTTDSSRAITIRETTALRNSPFIQIGSYQVSFAEFVLIILTILILIAGAIAAWYAWRLYHSEDHGSWHENVTIDHVLRRAQDEKATFFRSHTPSWPDFESGCVYQRKEVREISNYLERKQTHLAIIQGQKSAGKTVTALSVAYSFRMGGIFKNSRHVFVVRDISKLTQEQVSTFALLLRNRFNSRRTLAVVDECHLNPQVCERLVDDLSGKKMRAKLLFVTRSSYERGLPLEPGERSKLYESTPLDGVFKISTKDVYPEIVKWFVSKEMPQYSNMDLVSALREAFGNDLVLLGRTLLALRKSSVHAPGSFPTSEQLRQILYQYSVDDLEKLKSKTSEAPLLMIAVGAFYMYQIEVESDMLRSVASLKPDLVEQLAARGEITLGSDGSISMGHPSEAKLILQATAHLNTPEYRELLSRFKSLPFGIISGYLQGKEKYFKSVTHEVSLSDRLKLRRSFNRLSLGEQDEQNLVRRLIKDCEETVSNLGAGDLDDAFGWAAIGRNVSNFSFADKLSESGMDLWRKMPDWETPSGLYNGAILRRDFGHEEDALQLLERAVALNPDFAKARTVYANLLHRGHKDNLAKDQFEYMLSRNPDSITLSSAAHFYKDTGNSHKAEELFKESLDMRNLKGVPKDKRVSVYHRYAVFLASLKKYNQALEALKIAKAYALKSGVSVTAVINYTASIHEQKGDFPEADNSYRESLKYAQDITDPTVISYARFLTEVGNKIVEPDGRRRYPDNAYVVEAERLIQAWLEKWKEFPRHPNVLRLHHKLAEIQLNDFNPPRFALAEEELKQAYSKASQSGELQDAVTDLLFGALFYKRAIFEKQNYDDYVEEAEHFYRAAYNAFRLDDVVASRELMTHKLTSGNSLAMFLWQEKNKEAEPLEMFRELVELCTHNRQLNVIRGEVTTLHNYAQIYLEMAGPERWDKKSKTSHVARAKSLLEDALKLEPDNIFVMNSYASVLKEIARCDGTHESYMLAVNRYWQLLRHPNVYSRVNGKTVRNTIQSFQSACLGLATLLRDKALDKPWSALEILLFVFEKDKSNERIGGAILDTIWNYISLHTELSEAKNLIAQYPEQAMAWFLKGTILRRIRIDKEAMIECYYRAYELLGPESCRDALYREKSLMKWVTAWERSHSEIDLK